MSNSEPKTGRSTSAYESVSVTKSLRAAAKAVVNSYEGIEWGDWDEHDIVQLSLPTDLSCDKTEDVLWQIVFANSKMLSWSHHQLQLRDEALNRLQDYIKSFTDVTAVDQLREQSEAVEKCISAFRLSLEQFEKASSSEEKRKLLQKLNVVMCRSKEIYNQIVETTQRLKLKSTRMPPSPSRFYSVQNIMREERRLEIHLVIASAVDVVQLCGFIANSNPEKNTFDLETSDMKKARRYGEIFAMSDFNFFKVPICEDDSPTARILQKGLNNLVKKLRAFFKLFSAKPAVVTTDSPCVAGQEKADESTERKSNAPVQQAAQSTENSTSISIDDGCNVMVDGKDYGNGKSRNRRTLIGLAFFAKEMDTKPFVMNTSTFFEHVAGGVDAKELPSHNWNERINALRRDKINGITTFPYFKSKCKADQLHEVRGLCYTSKPLNEKIKDDLRKNPVQPRNRSSTSKKQSTARKK
jgi:hypothetical protein